MSPWLLLSIAALVNSVASILLKQARVVAEGSAIWLMIYSPWFLAACFCYVLNVFLFAKALDFLPVSLVYPTYAGAGFALIAVAGNLLFGERLGPNQYIGVALILAGIIAASKLD
jgi:small multidrug resistance pump